MDGQGSYDGGQNDLDMQLNDEPIRLMAQDCKDLFRKCLDRFDGTAELAIFTDLSRLVQEYHARFEAWSNYLAVFAGKNFCLDYRLRRHPALQDMIIRLLDTLRRNLFLVHVYEVSDAEGMLTTAPVDASGDHVMADVPSSNFDVAFSGIKESITHLNKLGMAIRSSSRSTTTARARRFMSQHPDLAPLSEFEDRAYILLDCLYPHAPRSLRQQLADTMTDRYARLHYERIRNQQPSETPYQPLSSSAGDAPLSTEIVTPAGQHNPWVNDQEDLGKSSQEKETKPVAVPPSSIDTNLLLSNLPAAGLSAPSKPPKTLTVLAARAKEPPTPTFEQNHVYTTCEWCYQVIDRSLINTKRNGSQEWSSEGRRHYRQDLQPYVCISEVCSASRPTFASSKDWFKHMRATHSEHWAHDIHNEGSWVCGGEHENDALYIFTSPDEAHHHILLHHPQIDGGPDEYTMSINIQESKSSPTLSGHSVFQSQRPVSCCPLCLFPLANDSDHKQQEGRPLFTENSDRQPVSWEMGSHIAEHLHYLTVVSLQLMSIMNMPHDEDGDGWSLPVIPSSDDEDPETQRIESRLDDLPVELQGPISWSDVEDSRSELVETPSHDWAVVLETTQPFRADQEGYQNSILDYLPEWQKTKATLGTEESAERPRALAVGIDFGDTFTSVSYAVELESLDTVAITEWPGSDASLIQETKVPSCIAYDRDDAGKWKEYWGYSAKPEMASYIYMGLLLNKNALVSAGDQPDLTEDIREIERTLPPGKDAQEVTADFFRCLYNYIMYTVEQHYSSSSIIHCPMKASIALPLTWSDEAQIKTLRAAVQAGFRSRERDEVSVISRPEAAVLGAMFEPSQFEGEDWKYEGILVCHCGSTTVDLTTYFVEDMNPYVLRETTIGVGAKIGEINLAMNLRKLLVNRFGEKFSSLPSRLTGLGSRMMKDFQLNVDAFSTADTDSKWELRLSLDVEYSAYYDRLRETIILTYDDMKAISQPVVDEIIKLSTEQVHSFNSQGFRITTLLLSGRLAGWRFLQNQIRESGFIRRPELNIPRDCLTLCANGAAVHGLRLASVIERKCRHHYGTVCSKPYDKEKHDRARAFRDPFTGQMMVRDCMAWSIHRGTTIVADSVVTMPFHSIIGDSERKLVVQLMSCSLPEAPELRNKHVQSVGKIIIDLSNADLSRFATKRVDGQRKYKIRYELEVVLGGRQGTLGFRVRMDGQLLGQANIEF